MKKIEAFISKHAYLVASSLIAVALLIDIVSYSGLTASNKFNAYLTVMFSFEVLLHSFLIYALVRKKEEMANIFMVSVKVFDAIFFAADVALRIDALINKVAQPTNTYIVNFVAYILSSLLLIAILIFYILNALTKKHKHWVTVKVCMIVTAIVMFACSMFEIYNIVKYSAHWFAFLEPLYMCFLMLGMFTICHYIEKDK